MPSSEATYERMAFEDPEGKWELVCGRLRSKPGMTVEHEDTKTRLVTRLIRQLDERDYNVRMDGPRLRVSTGTF